MKIPLSLKLAMVGVMAMLGSVFYIAFFVVRDYPPGGGYPSQALKTYQPSQGLNTCLPN